MPSDFENLFEQCASPLIDKTMGEAIGYRSLGRELEDARGVWNPEEFLDPSPRENGRVVMASGVLAMWKAIFVKFGRDPQEGDDVDIRGKTYSVTRVADADQGWFNLTVSATTVSDRSDGGLRRGRR